MTNVDPSARDSAALGDVPVHEFRAAAHATVDWIADYLEGAAGHPVRTPVAAGDIRRALPASAPRTGDALDATLEDFRHVILPGITHANHPSFFASVASSGAAPGIVGELLRAALNVNGSVWAASPAAMELEETALDWLRQLLGMGDDWVGEITGPASASTFHALRAARDAVGLDIRERGMGARTHLHRFRVYCSEHAQSSVDGAVAALGIGNENLVKIPADDAYRMRIDALANAIERDVDAGYRPLAIIPTVGTASTSSIDSVRDVVEIAKRHGCWTHVDGAHGAAAAVVPELRYILDGVDRADSIAVNPHQWLFTPADCSVLYTKRPSALQQASALRPEPIVTDDGDRLDRTPDGQWPERGFRSLALWMTMRAFGAVGLAERIRHHCELARDFAGMVYYEGDWELMAPVPLSVVCFRYAPPGASGPEIARLNAAIMQSVNASGRAFLSHTMLGDRFALRVAIGNIRTRREHVEAVWQALRAAAASVRGSQRG